MRAHAYLSLPLVALVALLHGCVSIDEDMAQTLDQMVGRAIPDMMSPTDESLHYVYRDIDNEFYELLSSRPRDCSYALKVSKSDGTVASWQFLSNPKPKDCKFINFRELM